MRPQLNPLILGPGAPWSLPGSSLDIQFTTGRAAVNRQTSSISSLLTTTRASTGYASTSTGSLTLFPTNTPRITDLGLLVEQAATNLFINSVGFGTGWGGNNAGATASIGVGTANFTVAPDGTTTATRVQLALNGATTSSDISEWIVTPSVTISNATAYTQGIWIKSNTGSSINMSITDVNNSGSQIVVTTTWTRFTLTATSSGTSANFQLRLRGGQTPVNPNTADISIWGGQLELGTFATSNISTTTVSVTRATDFITYPYNPLGAGNFTMFVSVGGVAVQTGKFPCLVSVNDGSGLNQAQIYSVNGGNTTSGKEQTSGVSRFDTIIPVSIVSGAGKIAMTLNGTAARGASNGGNLTALGTWTPTAAFTQMEIGTSDGSASNALNGYVKRLAIFQTGMNDAQMQVLTT